ncbi:MAG: ABC transporter ATP-binding protein [Methanocorpusculum sp.]|uniref:sulfate/molybdate ABC transporter ATP-binding protein n=1 Tax=Methanocorpusculum sp. TaxID=2058474 RepID=UPI002728C39C|nr:ABC transporter ATP-binding protein [Methanocorpusculum sp.]MDO9523541.1 ABC transporter ATP-binding protein [Methanocorpusculum sp.]
MLEATFTRQLRDFTMDVDLTVQSGETLALIGENGSGKSTTLKILSGLMKPESGKITLNNQVLYDSRTRRHIDPEMRNISYMFQNYALFPHMTVRENIAYGLTVRKRPIEEIRARTDELIVRMGLDQIADEPVTRLSGGQRQRTALARSLAPRPALLLLDEPLAALDVKTQENMRRELASVIRAENIPCILVTHSIIDALSIADCVSVIKRGTIVATGTPEDIIHDPTYGFSVSENPNLYRGDIHSGKTGKVCVKIGEIYVRAVTTLSGVVNVEIRPEELIISREKLASSAINSFQGKITEIRQSGLETLVYVDIGIPLAAALTPQSIERLSLKKGDPVVVTFKATAVHIFA